MVFGRQVFKSLEESTLKSRTVFVQLRIRNPHLTDGARAKSLSETWLPETFSTAPALQTCGCRVLRFRGPMSSRPESKS